MSLWSFFRKKLTSYFSKKEATDVEDSLKRYFDIKKNDQQEGKQKNGGNGGGEGDPTQQTSPSSSQEYEQQQTSSSDGQEYEQQQTSSSDGQDYEQETSSKKEASPSTREKIADQPQDYNAEKKETTHYNPFKDAPKKEKIRKSRKLRADEDMLKKIKQELEAEELPDDVEVVTVRDMTDEDLEKKKNEQENDGTVPEWNYEKLEYDQEIPYSVRPYSHIENELVAHFYEHYGFLVEEVIAEFQQFKPNDPDTLEYQKSGRVNAKRLINKVIDAQAGEDIRNDFYDREEDQKRDYAFSVLLDLSGSTTSSVTDDLSVLDVEKYSALLLAEAMNQMDDLFEIHSFDTEHHTYLQELKNVYESYDNSHREKILSLNEDYAQGGYTRLGSSIRATAKRFNEIDAEHKYLIVITDGSPYDDDYEHTYALEDTAKSIVDAEEEGIHVIYLNVDSGDTDYFYELSKAATYATVFKNVEDLPEIITEIYKEVSKIE